MHLVEKRDGRIEPWDSDKVRRAIHNAMEEAHIDIDENAEVVIARITSRLEKNTSLDTVDKIHDEVERQLMMTSYKSAASAYINTRSRRSIMREYNSPLMKQVLSRIDATNVDCQNANVDQRAFGGQMGEAASEVTRKIAIDKYLSPMARENHQNMIIYTHDLDHYILGDHNCLSIPFDDVLARGFKTKQVDIRPARSVSTAFQLGAVVMQVQSLQQFGGVAFTHLDWTMVPYVRISFWKHFKKGLKYFRKIQPKDIPSNIVDTLSIESPIYKGYPEVYEYAMEEIKQEIHQGVEGMYHNLGSLQSRSGGQIPFSSIQVGSCTLPEGRMIIEAVLDMSIEGLGKNYTTPIFPCLIFQTGHGINLDPGDPNYDLFWKALESTAKRLYPNYANLGWSGNAGFDPNDPRTFFSTMGCASGKETISLRIDGKKYMNIPLHDAFVMLKKIAKENSERCE